MKISLQQARLIEACVYYAAELRMVDGSFRLLKQGKEEHVQRAHSSSGK